jgi:hypothetical protein
MQHQLGHEIRIIISTKTIFTIFSYELEFMNKYNFKTDLK